MPSDVCYVGHTSNAYRVSDQPRCARRALAFSVNASQTHRIRTTIAAASELREPANRYYNRATIVYKQRCFTSKTIFFWPEKTQTVAHYDLRDICVRDVNNKEYIVIL